MAVGLGLALASNLSGQLPEGVTREMIDEGRRLFQTTALCATCHGDGSGTQLAPDLTDSEWIHIDGSYESIIRIIDTGVAEPRDPDHPLPMMPRAGSGMSDEEVRRVAAYTWSLSRRDGRKRPGPQR